MDGLPAREETADRDAFLITACYAADRCQGDLGCPETAWCYRRPSAILFPGGDDDYDDEGW